MRREGFELQVSQPQVITKEIDGAMCEPFEEVFADVRNELSGDVIKKLSNRKGVLTNIKEEGGISRLTFEIPTRGLLGYRGEFIIDTRGEGILSSRFIGFKPEVGRIDKHEYGSMISMEKAKPSVLLFGISKTEEHSILLRALKYMKA